MVVQKGIGFFLLPLYTAFLTPADYGIQAVVTSISSFLSMLLALDIDSAARRFYFKYNEDKEKAKSMYGTAAVVIIINSFFFGGLFILLHNLVLTPILGEVSFYPYVFLGLLYVLVNPLYLLYQSYLQTIQDGATYGINAFLYILVQVGLNIVLLVVFKLGVLAILYSQLIVAVIFFIYVAIRFLPTLKLGIDRVFLKEALRYSLPIIPHTLANWSNDTLDKLFVNKIRSAADTGIFGLAQQYSSVVGIASNAINQAYLPWFIKKSDNREFAVISSVSYASSLLVCLFASFFALFSKEILSIMISNPQYGDVYLLVPYIVFAYVFKSLYYYYVDVLYLKDTKIIFTITWTTVFFSIVANLALIPLFGIIGAAMACMLTFIVKSLMALIISSNRNKEIRFKWRSMYMFSFISFVGVLVITEFTSLFSTISVILLKCGFLVILALSIFLFNKGLFLNIRKMIKES